MFDAMCYFWCVSGSSSQPVDIHFGHNALLDKFHTCLNFFFNDSQLYMAGCANLMVLECITEMLRN